MDWDGRIHYNGILWLLDGSIRMEPDRGTRTIRIGGIGSLRREEQQVLSIPFQTQHISDNLWR